MEKPKLVKAQSFNDVMLELAEKQKAIEKKLAAMSPLERAQWEAQELQRQKETEEILKKLRGPGFVEIRIK